MTLLNGLCIAMCDLKGYGFSVLVINTVDIRFLHSFSPQCRRILAGRVDIPIGCSGRHLELGKQWRVGAR